MSSLKSLVILSALIFLSTVVWSQTPDNASSAAVESSTPQKANSQQTYSSPPPSKRSLRDRIYFGGYFGLQFGTYTSVDVSPLVGYRVTPDFNVGVGVLYTYTSFDYGSPIGNHSYSSWGGRLNANYTLFDLITLGAEYQYRTVEVYNYFENSFQNEGVNVLFLGGGLRQRIGRNSFMFLMAYYDVLQETYSPYNNVVFRVGVSAGF